MNTSNDNAIIEEYCVDSQPILRWEETDEGYLKLWISVAVADKDLEYYHTDGSKRVEYIDQSNLFDLDSLKTAIGKPFTVSHPPEPVLASNYRKYSHGTSLQEVINDDGRLVIASIITDPETIAGVKNKEIQYTSSAYKATKIPQTDGRLKQTKRKYNHFALLKNSEEPRAGNDSTIILDSKGAEQMTTGENTNTTNTSTNTETNQQTQQPTMLEMLAAINGLGETIKSALTPKTTTTATANADSADKKAEENKDSKQADTTKDLVGLWAEWKPVIEANNKTVDYTLDSKGVKELILGCFYDEAMIKKLDTPEKLDGFWINFEANKDSIVKKSGTKFTTSTNKDSTDPRNAFVNKVTTIPKAS